jgi:hypothetical protein
MSERPQTTYTRAVQASIAHESTHTLAWQIPCRACRDLRATEASALAALRQAVR